MALCFSASFYISQSEPSHLIHFHELNLISLLMEIYLIWSRQITLLLWTYNYVLFTSVYLWDVATFHFFHISYFFCLLLSQLFKVGAVTNWNIVSTLVPTVQGWTFCIARSIFICKSIIIKKSYNTIWYIMLKTLYSSFLYIVLNFIYCVATLVKYSFSVQDRFIYFY